MQIETITAGYARVSVDGREVGTVERGDWGAFGQGWAAVSVRNQAVAEPVVNAGAPVFATRGAAARWLAGENVPELVGRVEIAVAAGVAPNTVDAWRARHADFPTPIVDLAMGPVWRWSDVEAWLEKPRPTGRPRKA